MPCLLTLKDITVHFGARKALHNIHAHFHEGSLTAIAGPNGSGKSTLLKLIAGILPPSLGQMIWHQKPAPTLAYLPQSSVLARQFPISVADFAATGFYPAFGEQRRLSASQREQIAQALNKVGLADYGPRHISELSGGEFQRLLFARVCLQDAALILLDEPFAALDALSTQKLMTQILEWHQQGRTIICVLHDLLLIKKYFPESMVLQGRCLGSGHTHEMFEQKLLSFDLDMAELRAEHDKPTDLCS